MLHDEIRTNFDLYIKNFKNIKDTLNYIEIIMNTSNFSINTINKMIMHKLDEPNNLHPYTYNVPEFLLTNFVDIRLWLKRFCLHYGYDIALTCDFIMMMKHIKETEKLYKHLIQNQLNIHKKEFLIMIKQLIN
tara:strand:+ start:634 stop:1032 length:399 start_codon:yes stop_codon:yes gene_type:complete